MTNGYFLGGSIFMFIEAYYYLNIQDIYYPFNYYTSMLIAIICLGLALRSKERLRGGE